MNRPLTFTAEESNSTINLAANGSPVINGLQYRLSESDEWRQYKIRTIITLTNIGDYVQFQNTKKQLSISYDDYVYFVMTGKISASGNIQSMINYLNFCLPYCYYGMFYDCTNLTEAPELPATKLAKWCYYHMFYDCTSLTKVPELPATNLAYGCYAYMFSGCTSLTKSAELPATALTNLCYFGMFYGCTNLIEAPELLAINLADTCYNRMFDGCINLKNKPKINSLIEKVVYF